MMTVFTLPEFGNKKHFTVMTSFHFELTLKREEWNGLGITRPHSYIFYPALYKESRPFIHDVNWPWAIIHGSPSHLLSFIVLHLILIIIISEWSTWTIADSAQEEFCPSFHCGHTPQTVTTTWAPTPAVITASMGHLTSKIRCACDVAVELTPHLVIQPSRRFWKY